MAWLRSTNFWVGVGIAVVLFSFKWQTLALPFFWDEMGAYVEHVFRAHDDFLNFFTAAEFVGHPPGLQFIVWFFHKLFGATIVVTRVVCLLEVCLLLFVIVLAGKRFGGWGVGLFAALNTFCLPIIFAQSTMFLGDINYTPFIFLYTYLFFVKRYKLALWVGLLCGLLRETSVLFTPVLLLFSIWPRVESSRLKIIAAVAPLITFFGFMISNFLQTGYFFTHQAAIEGHFVFSLAQFGESFIKSCRMIFVEQYLYIFLIPFLIGLMRQMFFPHCQRIVKEYVIATIVTVLIFVLFNTFDSGRLVRYFIPIIPGVVLMGTYFIWSFFRRYSWILQIAILVFLVRHQSSTKPEMMGTAFETEMQYVDVIEISQAVTHYVEKTFADKIILSPWPLFHMFHFPYMGYVSKEMKIEYLRDDINELEPCGPFDVFVWSGNSDVRFINSKERFVQKYDLQLVRNFEHKGKIAEVYTRSVK